VNTQIVTNELIYNYFDELSNLIKTIIIDDDTQITLIGNKEGKINNGAMPIIGWKNYWYGKFKIINYLQKLNIDENELIINCRFDINCNSFSFNETQIIDFINQNYKKKFIKNIFFYKTEHHYGIDNIYIGNINTMHKLISKFFYELDDILSANKNIKNQEF
jgi:hypothetical protein